MTIIANREGSGPTSGVERKDLDEHVPYIIPGSVRGIVVVSDHSIVRRREYKWLCQVTRFTGEL